MGIPNTSDNAVLVGSSNSPVQDFLKNPPKIVPPTKDTPSKENTSSSQDLPPEPTPPPSTAASNIPFTEEDRNRIGKKLTEAIAQAVQSGNLATEEQLGEIIDDVLILVNQIDTQEDLGLVFDALAEKWPFLSPIIMEEQKQQNAIHHVNHMFKKQTNSNSMNVS